MVGKRNGGRRSARRSKRRAGRDLRHAGGATEHEVARERAASRQRQGGGNLARRRNFSAEQRVGTRLEVNHRIGGERVRLHRARTTAIRYRGHDLMLITQHQLKGVDERQVAMLTDDGSRIITSSGRRGYHPNPESDANDVVAFNFTEPVAAFPELRPRFST